MKPSVLIVGGGIGGLTLALLLRKQGMEPRVIEKSPEYKPVGAGIILAANAIAVLEKLGLRGKLEQAGRQLEGGAITDAKGQTLLPMNFSSRNISAIALHRGRLQEVLLEALQVELGTTVERLEQHPNKVSVRFNTDKEAAFDYVIGTDGIHSSIRGLVFGDVQPQYAGYSSWRFVVPQPGSVRLEHPVEMWGSGKRLGLVPIGGNMMYGYTTQNAPQGQLDAAENRLERFQTLFAEFGGVAPAVLATLDKSTHLISTQIEEIQLERWVKGRVALLGDSAHAMTPNLGQGAGMAIEDAFVLSEQLGKLNNPSALIEYERLRKPRVQQVQNTSRLLGQLGQWSFGPAVAVRNALLKLTPESQGRQQVRMLLEGGPA